MISSVSGPTTLTFDQLSIVLIILVILVAAFNGLRNRPMPSMYPILLGMQSDLARVRRKSESPIFRNTGSGMGMLPTSPTKSIKDLHDLIAVADGKFNSLNCPQKSPKGALKMLVAQARLQLWSILKEIPNLNDGLHPRFLILISDPYLDLVFSLAAATLPCTTLRILVHSSDSIPVEIQQACQRQLHHLALILCDSKLQEAVKDWTASHCQPKILGHDDVSDWFDSKLSTDIKESDPDSSQDGVFMTLHLSTPTEKKEESYFISFTPKCLLAGVTAALAMFPMSKGLSSTDRVGIEMNSNALWGFEAAIATAATYAGAEVCYFQKIEELNDWQPTVLVCRSEVLENLAQEIRLIANQKLSYKLIIGRNLSYLNEGILANKVIGFPIPISKSLRTIFTRGPLTQSSANVLRAGLGTSLQQVYSNALVAGPILATKPGDFQSLGNSQSILHYGPPTATNECKIIGIPEPSILDHDAIKGQLAVKGPAVTNRITDTQTGKNVEGKIISEGFLLLSENSQLLTNGTVRILSNDLSWDQ
ncbi:hypothetical protein CROQUDRAFT_674709 [Cronartium quercuum f. sp. fusiforme G11]|uniref:AMP-dependent synthetase/ligase domain-containing protein n=1 Tax=Cronartium quercuum f. sp. fusiforme G11 TaxID=708437 RepID=A0A9P6T7D6_9BASI|nr:hypothetical protein CROQUDRAFT_674709 [Cronartium quercuum f. sp. fusiforme G11]